MLQDRESLPTTSMVLLAGALFLFGIGGGLVGYMIGERNGEQRAVAITAVLGATWETHRGDAASRFAQAMDETAAALGKSAADLRAQVSMYHGCGGICAAIANQFGDELEHAGQALKKRALPPLPSWQDMLGGGGGSATQDSARADATFSTSAVLAAVALICGTVVLCFGIACVTLLRLRSAAP
jgi:hypothetical protein